MFPEFCAVESLFGLNVSRAVYADEIVQISSRAMKEPDKQRT